MAHEYLFDVKLFASIRLRAENEQQARSKLKGMLDSCTVNFGEIDDNPIVGEASLSGDDDGPDLMEVDGEPV